MFLCRKLCASATSYVTALLVFVCYGYIANWGEYTKYGYIKESEDSTAPQIFFLLLG